MSLADFRAAAESVKCRTPDVRASVIGPTRLLPSVVGAGVEEADARPPGPAMATTPRSEAATDADRRAFAIPGVRNAVLERVRTGFRPD